MPRDLNEAAKEVFDALGHAGAPQDFILWIEEASDAIMFGTAEHAVTIRRKSVEDGTHVIAALAVLPYLAEGIKASRIAVSAPSVERSRPSAHIHLVEPAVDLSKIGRAPAHVPSEGTPNG